MVVSISTFIYLSLSVNPYILYINQSIYLGSDDIPTGLGFGQGEYYPYVYFKINIDMVSTTSVIS